MLNTGGITLHLPPLAFHRAPALPPQRSGQAEEAAWASWGQLEARRAGVRAQLEAELSARPAGGGGAPGVNPQQGAGGGAELRSTRALTTCASSDL